ncbi:uncharacterized protein LY89DRAFT_112201 [Mollisia scopiformis]|uniref:Uncharacterized protein n=1 Tax=Mollisia scopiformis TaxID=149040 RepID=A0A194X5H4_MOLSC|nr:uncharacterized protein LY89DRAFT_112201 [Mollisia scopiformis]KUJ15421.1 hypothetical protein LY89DRAFT_112201 [Mollisia scopiformis]
MAKREHKPLKEPKLPEESKSPKKPKPPKASKSLKEPKPSKKTPTKPPRKSAKKDRIQRTSSRTSLRFKPTRTAPQPVKPGTLSRSTSNRVINSGENIFAVTSHIQPDGLSRRNKSGIEPATNATHVLTDRLPQSFVLYSPSFLNRDITISLIQDGPRYFTSQWDTEVSFEAIPKILHSSELETTIP